MSYKTFRGCWTDFVTWAYWQESNMLCHKQYWPHWEKRCSTNLTWKAIYKCMQPISMNPKLKIRMVLKMLWTKKHETEKWRPKNSAQFFFKLVLFTYCSFFSVTVVMREVNKKVKELFKMKSYKTVVLLNSCWADQHLEYELAAWPATSQTYKNQCLRWVPNNWVLTSPPSNSYAC